MDSAFSNTPAFLLWAIEYSCPIRGLQNGADPDHTERQLRAATALSTARREGRVFEGYCVDPPLGFRIDEALAIYGGLEAVERTCGSCPANTQKQNWPGALAGCIGMFAVPGEEVEFYRLVNEVVEQFDSADEYSRLFPTTKPRWLGFWMSSPLKGAQFRFLLDVLERLDLGTAAGEGWAELQTGLRVAHEHGMPFHASLYPRGVVQSRQWRLVPHCPRCKADWTSSGRGRCVTCGHEGHAAPDKKRSVRGRRPYLPLERLMGAEAEADFMARYEKSGAGGR